MPEMSEAVIKLADVVQPERRPPHQAGDGGSRPAHRLIFDFGEVDQVNSLLEREHYLGPIRTARRVVTGSVNDEIVAAMIFRWPTSRRLPSDGTWLELVRWCLTPAAGPNAGSRMCSWAVRRLRLLQPQLTTLVSYSDPSVGHTGALYRASGWEWKPTWLRLRPPPSGNGSWGGKGKQSIKDRWAYAVRPDDRWGEIFKIRDEAIMRKIERGEFELRQRPSDAGT